MADISKASDATTDDTSSSFNFDFLFFDENANDTTQSSDNTLSVNTAKVTNENQTINDNFQFFFDAFENDHECNGDTNINSSNANINNSGNTNKDNPIIQTRALSNTFTTSESQSNTNDDTKFDDIFNFINNFTSTEEEIKDEIKGDEKATWIRNKNVEPIKTTIQSKNNLPEEESEEELQQELKEQDREQANKCTVESMHNNNANTTNQKYINIVKDESEDEEEMPPPSSFTLSRSRTTHTNNHHHHNDNSSSSSLASTSVSPDAFNIKQDKSLAQRTTSSVNKVDKNINDKLHTSSTTSINLSGDANKCATDKHLDAVSEQGQSSKTSICKPHSKDKKENNAKSNERSNRHSSTLPLTSTLELNVSDLLCRAQALVQSANVRLLTDTSGENANKVSLTTTGTSESQTNEKKATVMNASSDLHFNNTVHTLIKQTTHTRQDVIIQTEELQMKAIDTLKLFGPHPTLANIVLEHLYILHDAPCPLFTLLMEFLQSDAPDKDKEEERRQFAAITPVVQLLPIINCLLQKLIAVE